MAAPLPQPPPTPKLPHMKTVKVVGIIYNPVAPKAPGLAQQIAHSIGPARESWLQPAGSSDITDDGLAQTDLIITVGGDGTILRAARVAVLHDIPLLGVNLGRLGFMTELRARDALDRIPQYLEGGGRLEERSMLKAQVLFQDPNSGSADPTWHHALNDIVLGRGSALRLIGVQAVVNGANLTSYRADAVIVSSATGTTGYNLSAGGPILDPRAKEMVLKPVAPHVGLATAVVLPSSATIDLTVDSTDGAILSVDGYLDHHVQNGDGVRIRKSPKTAKFLRERSSKEFYSSLTRRLGFEGGMGAGRPVFY